MFDPFSDGYCPQCLLDDRKVPMQLNVNNFWECPVCHLQAMARGIFTILRTRGSGKWSPRVAGTKATDEIIGSVLTKLESWRGDPKDAGIASIKKDLDSDALDLFENIIDAFEHLDRKDRRRNIPDWLAKGTWFESEDDLRRFLENGVEAAAADSGG